MQDAMPGANPGADEPYLGDMTTVARRTTPTEANLLKNVLVAAGDPAASFQVSMIVSGFTFVWYVFSGRVQSAHIAQSFGSQYVKRPLFPLGVATFAAMFLIGLAGEVLA